MEKNTNYSQLAMSFFIPTGTLKELNDIALGKFPLGLTMYL